MISHSLALLDGLSWFQFGLLCTALYGLGHFALIEWQAHQMRRRAKSFQSDHNGRTQLGGRLHPPSPPAKTFDRDTNRPRGH